VKSDADAFGHAATHAPHPMQVAASNARSAFSFGTRMLFASRAEPVGAVTKPPRAMMRSNAPRSTIRSFTTGNAFARHGSMTISSPSWNFRMWSWQVVVRGWPAVRPAVDDDAARAADALAAVVVERDRVFALLREVLVHDVEHLEERHVRIDVVRLVADELAGRLRVLLAPDVQREVHL
jgi:hypothetical protein